ncbi:MAG: adenosylmethionine--8-amino-7-oxononanoate transaminase [Steroidobacteraceae bacterium]
MSPIWHPFTQHALEPPPRRLIGAEGAWLKADDGRGILDAISSWWVITHGHRHPRIVAAIREQAARLDQVIFAEFTHQPAERLAAGLIAIAPRGLSHVFFSDSGSTSVEVAIKMALGFWRHTGRARTRIIVLEHSYHGDTVGTMSVGARGPFNEAYEPLLFDVGRIPFPHAGREAETLAALERLCRTDDTAALLVEPLILGAGGMLMYPPAVLAEMRRICAAHEVLFIADEVMTGWGRTGTRFACEQAGVTPDIVCYSKGLTGGSVPLAVTLCGPAVYQAHYSSDRRRMLFHSSSFTANPIACAAALANLDVWQHEPVLERIRTLSDLQRHELEAFRDDARFSAVRQLGTITAMEVGTGDSGYLAQIGPRLRAQLRDSGVLLRPLGNTLYVMPPYCISAAELQLVYAAIRSAVEALDVKPRTGA